MSDVEFELENEGLRGEAKQPVAPILYPMEGNASGSQQGSSLPVGILMKIGIAKTVEQANYILIGMAIFFIIVSIYLFFFNSPDRYHVESPLAGITQLFL